MYGMDNPVMDVQLADLITGDGCEDGSILAIILVFCARPLRRLRNDFSMKINVDPYRADNA